MYLFLPLVVIGQLAICVALVNRIHSLGYPRWMLKAGDFVCYAFSIAGPLCFLTWLLQNPANMGRLNPPTWLAFYVAACCLAVAVFVVTRIYQNHSIKTTSRLISNHTQKVDIARNLGHRPTNGSFTSLCARLPFNEILQISVREKTLRMPRLDPALDGLRITHLSDLHMTGQLTKPFYEEVVRIVNEKPSDIVAITGDIVEKVPCLDWIQDTLGQLTATHGVYFVFGNHERRIPDEQRVRSALTDAGLINLGSTWKTITHNGRPIVAGGNELPWYFPAVDFADSPAEVDGHRPFRMLLTHSPDQMDWAREHDCDLMLAGHTHGGQVRFPVIGPILAPSRMGTRFASGSFFYEPTLIHVSRGLAGTRPLRLNCQPEIARLVLQSDA